MLYLTRGRPTARHFCVATGQVYAMLCETLLDSSRICCLVSGLVVLAWPAACFPAEVVGKVDGTTWWWCSSRRRIATGLVIAAGVLYVQSLRRSTLAVASTLKLHCTRRSVALPWRGHAVGSGHAGGAFVGLEAELLKAWNTYGLLKARPAAA